jgi:hypothetical protein
VALDAVIVEESSMATVFTIDSAGNRSVLSRAGIKKKLLLMGATLAVADEFASRLESVALASGVSDIPMWSFWYALEALRAS